MFKERRGKNQSTHPEQQQSDKLVVTVVKIYITTKLLSISIYKKGLRFEWWWIREWRMTSANNNMLVLKDVWFRRISFKWKNRNSFQKRIWLDPNSSYAFDSTGKVLSNTKCSFLDELRLAVAGFELLKRKVCKTIFRKIRCCLMKIGQLAPLLLC